MPTARYALGAARSWSTAARRASAGDGGSIAGSTLTMDAAVRRAVRDLGVPMADAVRGAATTPARVLGLDRDVGAIAACGPTSSCSTTTSR